MDSGEIIGLLNKDLVGEIEAILIYLKHFLTTRECEPSREIEEIAIDEMRHAEWLGEFIVELGGIPDVDHGPLDFGGRRMEDMFSRDVHLEQEAIRQYQEHIDVIEDPKIKKRLIKIRMEEEEHLDKFKELLKEL